MIFQGIYNGASYTKDRTTPIFSSEKKIIVFDVEGVLVLPGRNRNGGYGLNSQACCVIEKVLHDDNFSDIVFWSTSHHALGMGDFYFFDAHRALQKRSPFNKVNQRIGGSGNKEGGIVKDLQIISPELSNVVAIEDDDFFSPKDRVIKYKPRSNLMISYHMAVDILGRAI